ncbi:MAG: hypothetical protein WCP06_07095 [Verrucomicrobiota bacterium]
MIFWIPGATLHAIRNKLTAGHRAAQRPVAVPLRKEKERAIPMEADYVGFDIRDEFVVGYGLDFHGGLRSLPYIGILEA